MRLGLSTVCTVTAIGLAAPSLMAAVMLNLASVTLLGAVIPAPPAVSPDLGPIRYQPPSALSPEVIQKMSRSLTWAASWGEVPAHAGAMRADLAMRQGRYAEAVDGFARAQRSRGGARYRFPTGNAQLLAGDRPGALASWMSAAPTPAERLALANQLFAQSDWQRYHPDRWLDAIQVLELARQQSGLAPDVRLSMNVRLANMYEDIGKHDEAIVVITQALELAPDAAEPRSWLAWLLQRQGRDDAALAEGSRSLSSTGNRRAHGVRGSIFLRRCQLDAAQTEFEAGLAFPVLEYRGYDLLIGLGDVYWEQGRPNDALAQWREFARLQPANVGIAERINRAQAGALERKCGGAATTGRP